MSKIEDALKKAKRNHVTPLTGRTSNSTDLVYSSNNESSKSVAKANSKEIVLMHDVELFDNKQRADFGIIFSGMGDRKLANAYRDIRTKLIQKSKGDNFIVMVTSCYSNDDTGVFALNLATAFTFDESKTSLLIDCDLHNSKLSNKIDLDSDIGLTNYLVEDDINVETIVQKSGIKRLRMISVGTQNETVSECFTSLKMRSLMSDLLSRYSDRYIFISSAPVKEAADTRILLELCDYVVLTVPYGRSTMSGIKDAVDAIGEDKLLGVVFNDIPNIPGFSFKKTRRS